MSLRFGFAQILNVFLFVFVSYQANIHFLYVDALDAHCILPWSSLSSFSSGVLLTLQQTYALFNGSATDNGIGLLIASKLAIPSPQFIEGFGPDTANLSMSARLRTSNPSDVCTDLSVSASNPSEFAGSVLLMIDSSSTFQFCSPEKRAARIQNVGAIGGIRVSPATKEGFGASASHAGDLIRYNYPGSNIHIPFVDLLNSDYNSILTLLNGCAARLQAQFPQVVANFSSPPSAWSIDSGPLQIWVSMAATENFWREFDDSLGWFFLTRIILGVSNFLGLLWCCWVLQQFIRGSKSAQWTKSCGRIMLRYCCFKQCWRFTGYCWRRVTRGARKSKQESMAELQTTMTLPVSRPSSARLSEDNEARSRMPSTNGMAPVLVTQPQQQPQSQAVASAVIVYANGNETVSTSAATAAIPVSMPPTVRQLRPSDQQVQLRIQVQQPAPLTPAHSSDLSQNSDDHEQFQEHCESDPVAVPAEQAQLQVIAENGTPLELIAVTVPMSSFEMKQNSFLADGRPHAISAATPSTGPPVTPSARKVTHTAQPATNNPLGPKIRLTHHKSPESRSKRSSAHSSDRKDLREFDGSHQNGDQRDRHNFMFAKVCLSLEVAAFVTRLVYAVVDFNFTTGLLYAQVGEILATLPFCIQLLSLSLTTFMWRSVLSNEGMLDDRSWLLRQKRLVFSSTLTILVVELFFSVLRALGANNILIIALNALLYLLVYSAAAVSYLKNSFKLTRTMRTLIDQTQQQQHRSNQSKAANERYRMRLQKIQTMNVRATVMGAALCVWLIGAILYGIPPSSGLEMLENVAAFLAYLAATVISLLTISMFTPPKPVGRA